MGYTVLTAEQSFWRPSNQMSVMNTDVAKQLRTDLFGARFWHLMPGQASTRHRHLGQHELYVVVEGSGRIRIDGELLTLSRYSTVLVEPDSLRQVFNDTAAPALWFVVGVPKEAGNTLEMTPELLQRLYPDGPKALPPELA
jgi:mannose-6-phosphate isomerase-like protein (cupin superfamily)